jgi:uncharacterized protein (TIGR03435 family)
MSALCAFACVIASSIAARSQHATPGPAIQGDAPAPMAFAKVMMFPDTSDGSGGFLWWGRASDPHDEDWIIFKSVSSSKLIASAYGLGIHQLIGLPAWAEADRFDLSGNMSADTFEAFQKLPSDERLRQQRLMMQAALAGRYQLQVHRETREMPVYELVVASGGLKVSETDPDPLDHGGASFFRPRNWNNSGTMQDLASQLGEPADGIVIDKTGLGNKRFRYQLKWNSDGHSNAAGGDTSIFTALEEQLGLKLVRATDPVKVLVIDHIEKPTAGMSPEVPSRASL